MGAYGQFVLLTDSAKSFLVDINIGDVIHDDGWTQHGTHTNLWYTSYTKGVPNAIYEDGVAYTEYFTLAEANSNVNSFYYDFENQVLYVRTTNTDDPGKQTTGEYDYFVFAFFWKNYSNLSPIVFPRRQKALIDGRFEEWTSATNLTHWTESIAGTSTVNRETDVDEVYEGGYCVRLDIDASNNNASIYQSIRLIPKGKTKIKFRYKNSTTGKTAKIQIKDSANNVYLDSNGDWQAGATWISLSNNESWIEYSLEFYTHKDYTNYVITFANNSAASSSIYFDAAELTRFREDNYYEPLLQSADLPSIHQAVSDYHIAAMKMQFGRLRFNNPDGVWYPETQNFYWHNKEIIVRYGEEGAEWGNYEEIFQGRTKKPKVEDKFCEFTISDKRVLVYKEIPEAKYWVTDYPNLEDAAEGCPIPILYGEFENILPIEINTVLYKFKIANHQIQSIDAVYKDGKLLAAGGIDYTADLPNGEFTLTYNPGSAVISCDVKGKLCDMQDGTYSDNVADITYDLLKTYGGIADEFLDKESFLDMKTWRTQHHHLYLDVGQSVIEILRNLQASALFHIIPVADKFGAFRYISGVTSTTPTFGDEDYGYFKLVYDTTGIYKQVKIKYNRNPGDDKYETILRTKDQVEWAHEETNTITITTTLRNSADANNLGDFYIDLLKDPLRKVEANLPTEIFNMRPAEKIILSKTRKTEDGQVVTVLDEVAYRVLDLRKDMKTKRVNIVAWEDLQSTGELFCEVCNSCQVCVTTQTGSCTVCYSCEKCDSGQCESCMSCFYCEKCDAGECTLCMSCDSCEKCDTGECDQCMTCDACEKCDAGECELCMSCDECQKCDTCENAQCTICQSCDLCQKCDTCENAQCTMCESCDLCQKCDTCENAQCTQCESCFSCEKCDSGECTACMTCVICMKCNAGECESCQLCDICEKCDAGLCTVCMNCDICQKCDTGQCTICMSCDSCEKCDSGECTICMSCIACQACESCDVCFKCEQV